MIESFRNAIRHKPGLTDAYLGLANALIKTGQVADAAHQLRQTLQVNPADVRAKKLLDQISSTNP